jgi:purine-cytosine permease-like protein
MPRERRLQAQLRWVEYQSKFLRLSSSISGFYLLVLLPAIVVSGFFLPFWKLLAALFVIFHGLVIAEFFAATRLWRSTDRNSYFQTLIAISLNPLAAIRSADLLSKWVFEQAHPQQLETVLGKSRSIHVECVN